MFKIFKSKNVVSIICIFFSCYLLFMMPNAVKSGVSKGLELCVFVIIPSLFPFMVLSGFIVKSNVLSPVYKALAPLTNFLFKQPSCTVAVIFMGLIGGFPVGTKMTASLLEEGRITQNQAQRLCMFCVNGGPAFIITAVGVNMLGNFRAGVVMFVSLSLSSLVLGFISRFFDDKCYIKLSSKSNGQSPLLALSSAVADNINAILSICAWVVIFNGLTECIRQIKFADNVYMSICAVLEVTNGCTLTAGKIPLEIIAAIIGFGGLCVHCQIYSFIKESGLKYIRFFTGRIINGGLSAVICHLLLKIFPVHYSTAVQNVEKFVPLSVSVPAVFVILTMCIIMILDIDNKRRIC